MANKLESPLSEYDVILIVKIVFIFVIMGIALLFGILPAKIKGCG